MECEAKPLLQSTFLRIRIHVGAERVGMFLPPGLEWLLRAADAFMHALFYLFIFGLVAHLWRTIASLP